jgi:hypothetical protein
MRTVTRACLVALMALAMAGVGTLLVDVPTAGAILYPDRAPRFVGDETDTWIYIPIGMAHWDHECFVADWEIPDGEATGIMDWVPVPCNYRQRVGNYRDWNDWYEWRAPTFSVLEQQDDGDLITSAHVHARRFGQVTWMPPGTLSAATRLFVWNDGGWWEPCRESGWMDMPFWAPVWAPAINWGPAPCGFNRWYNGLNTSHLWNGSFWQGTTRWSGAMFVGSPF